tara:strand:- start:851 stop:1138 length:288 start_codon:yes stop_codon:yes gene_type:complete
MIILKLTLELKEGNHDDWVKESINLSRHLNCDVKFEGGFKIVTLKAESKKEVKSKIISATTHLAKKGIEEELFSEEEVDEDILDTLDKLKQAVSV